MSKAAEKVLFQHVVDLDGLTVIVREGVDPEILPTESLRPVLSWAVDYFFKAHRQKAPSLTAIEEEFGPILQDQEIDLEVEPEDSIEWAIESLKADHIRWAAEQFQRRWARQMTEAPPSERVLVLHEGVQDLIKMQMGLEPRRTAVSSLEGPQASLAAYEDRAGRPAEFRGMRLGLREVDNHTYGIHPSELAILAGGPKSGKSFMCCWSALQEFTHGRVTVLYTLENSIEMMWDRLACLAVGVDYRRYQRGQCGEGDLQRIREWVRQTQDDHPGMLWILQPEMGKCSVPALIRDAQVRDAQSVIIDQLSHIEFPDPRKPRTERIGDALRMLHAMVRGTEMSTLLAHQLSRDGIAAARKLGYPLMEHMAESADVERTCDWAFALFSSQIERNEGLARFFTLAARREDLKAWMLNWSVGRGLIGVREELNLEAV